MNLLYRLFFKGFLRYQANRQQKREGLVHGFYALDGTQYHTYQKLSDMPHNRYAALLDIYSFWSMKLSPTNLDQFCDIVVKANENQLHADTPEKRAHEAARINSIVNEIRLRNKETAPVSIALEAAALMSIHPKENPKILDPVFHTEKIDKFTADLYDGHAFFLKLPIWTDYFNSSSEQRGKLLQKLENSRQAEARTRALIHAFSSGKL